MVRMEEITEELEQDPSYYVSFMLRCWSGADAQIHARLIEVPSGISHPVANLSDLAGLLQDLLLGRQGIDSDRPLGLWQGDTKSLEMKGK